MMKIFGCALLSLAVAAGIGSPSIAVAEETKEVIERSQAMVPEPPWPEGDQVGMANTLGRGTWLRCAQHLSHPRAKVYEVSHVRSQTMPTSPFGVPLEYEFRPSLGIPGTRHGFNGESLKQGEPGAQGTQMDALGHFGYLPETWDGQGDYPADQLRYYGGYTQPQVKPTPDSPLLKLGMEHAPPIVTTAVLLDARAYLGKGHPLEPGRLVTADDLKDMLDAQGWARAGCYRAMSSISTPAGRSTGRIRMREVSTTRKARVCPTTPPATSRTRPSRWSLSTIRSPIRLPRARSAVRRRCHPVCPRICRGSSITTI